MQARLLEGVDESLLEEDAGRVSVAQGSPARFANAPAWADVFCGYANHDLGAAEDLPVFRGALMTDYVRSFCPFGRASGHMASLLSRLYWRQRGLPALAVAPLSRVRLAWRLGKLELADVLCDRAEYEATYRRDPEDLTVYQTLTAQFACHALAEMERRVSSHVERDVAIGAILRRCSGFNQRQRAVIARSLQVKDARFSIRGHHGEFGVSCTTARRDLAELVREGFLRVVPQGKAYVFVADDRAVKLKEIVDQRAGASDTSGRGRAAGRRRGPRPRRLQPCRTPAFPDHRPRTPHGGAAAERLLAAAPARRLAAPHAAGRRCLRTPHGGLASRTPHAARTPPHLSIAAFIAPRAEMPCRSLPPNAD